MPRGGEEEETGRVEKREEWDPERGLTLLRGVMLEPGYRGASSRAPPRVLPLVA